MHKYLSQQLYGTSCNLIEDNLLCNSSHITEHFTEKRFEKVQSFLAESNIVICTTKGSGEAEHVQQVGLTMKHAYSVLSAHTINDNR